jgi:thiol:disulfide interchange protein DsbC
MSRRIAIVLAGLIIICTAAQAKTQNSCERNCADCHTLSQSEAKTVLKDLGDVKDVRMSSVKGLWRIDLEKEGREAVAFMDFAKKNLIVGKIFPLDPGKLSKQETLQQAPAGTDSKLIDTALIPLESSIIMGNPKGTRKLFVFTDPDCPFCRKVHVELHKLEKTAPDVAIYLMLTPLPMHPRAYDKSRALLAKKSGNMLDMVFGGLEILPSGENDGRDELDRVIRFANSNGIATTPTIVFSDGSYVSGFRDAEALKMLLESKK